MKNIFFLTALAICFLPSCKKEILGQEDKNLPDTLLIHLRKDTSLCVFSFYKAVIIDVSVSSPTAHYFWLPGNPAIDTVPIKIFSRPFAYKSYTVFIDTGQSYSTQIKFHFNWCEPVLFFPISFAPNADGINDIWKPMGFGIDKFYLNIRNEDRVSLFTSHDINSGWNGTYKDKSVVVPEGTYLYYCEWTYMDGSFHKTQGRLMLVK